MDKREKQVPIMDSSKHGMGEGKGMHFRREGMEPQNSERTRGSTPEEVKEPSPVICRGFKCAGCGTFWRDDKKRVDRQACPLCNINRADCREIEICLGTE